MLGAYTLRDRDRENRSAKAGPRCQSKNMKKLLALLLFLVAPLIARAQPTAVLEPWFSYHSTYYIPDQQAEDRTSTYKLRVFSRTSSLYYAQDQVDAGSVWAERYGVRVYRYRNTWVNPALRDPVHSQMWWDGNLMQDEWVTCGGSCYPELYPTQSVGGFTVSYSGNPEFGNAYWAINTSAQTRIKIAGGEAEKSYVVRIAASAWEITDRSMNCESSMAVQIPNNEIRISGGYILDSSGTVFVTVPGNGNAVSVTPYCYPTRTFFRYSIWTVGSPSLKP